MIDSEFGDFKSGDDILDWARAIDCFPTDKDQIVATKLFYAVKVAEKFCSCEDYLFDIRKLMKEISRDV